MRTGHSTERAPLTERMRARGLRLTSQRRILADLLENAEEHLDADAFYELARRKDPGLHRATVYRFLNRLKKLGLIDELDLMHVSGDRHFYEMRPSDFHIHLVCMSCGSIEEPGGSFWRTMPRRVQKATGFKPEVTRLEMGGLCVKCQSRGPSED